MLPWVIRTFLAYSGGSRTSQVIRTIAFTEGYQDTKNGCQDLFYVSAKNVKQTNTFIGFSEYVSILIRLYTKIECHI